MRQLESQQIMGVRDESSLCYEVILWESVESEELEFQERSFVVEVREVWEPLFANHPNSRQVSLIEIGSQGMAQAIYHYTAETLYGL